MVSRVWARPAGLVVGSGPTWAKRRAASATAKALVAVASTAASWISVCSLVILAATWAALDWTFKLLIGGQGHAVAVGLQLLRADDGAAGGGHAGHVVK